MKLVFVHGRSQGGKNAEELRLFWEGCLDRAFYKAGLAWPKEAEVILPFYADDLDRMVAQVDSPLVTNVMLRGVPQVYPPNFAPLDTVFPSLPKVGRTSLNPSSSRNRGFQQF